MIDFKIQISTAGQPGPDPGPQPTKKFVGWRALHMAESDQARVIPYSMPGVIPPIVQEALEMTREIQLMSYELMLHFSPVLTRRTWRACHKVDLCLNNNDVDGYDGSIVHADWVNNRDLNATLPRYDKQQRTFQGTFITGSLVGDRIRCVPGVDGIDARGAMPDVATIVKNNWYVLAVNVGRPANNLRPSDFAQGQGYPIAYPFIFNKVIEFPARYFVRWESDELPVHTGLYL